MSGNTGRGDEFAGGEAEHGTDNDWETLNEGTDPVSSSKGHTRKLRLKSGVSFFLFGLINNVLYVIILSAALDLVPPSTPKGIIAFCNIFPALVAKIGWPYILKGQIRYARRLNGCCLLSVLGMVVVAMFDSLIMRLLGISLASFSSGLGELTFLQLSTTYPPSVAAHGIGYFASGTGAAGLVGAFMWWELRALGVRTGVGLSAVMPFVIPVTYYFLLPGRAEFVSSAEDMSPGMAYTSLAATEDEDEVASAVPILSEVVVVALSLDDKWKLVKPMLVKYMLPLFCVYTFEYTINQGIAPTLLYPVPSPDSYPILSKIIHSIRDYYPLWQLVYQTVVFPARSSISLGIPPISERFLPLPAIIQFFILFILGLESARGIFGNSEGESVFLVFSLISLEGICGGLAYVNVYHQINKERPEHGTDPERAKQEREFKIGSVSFADSLGILFAAILAVPTEVELCKAQVRRGKTLCQGL